MLIVFVDYFRINHGKCIVFVICYFGICRGNLNCVHDIHIGGIGCVYVTLNETAKYSLCL